jgi:hypothetical protein
MVQFLRRLANRLTQSGKFTARTSPAFACLLYYHKLDAATIESAKVRRSTKRQSSTHDLSVSS